MLSRKELKKLICYNAETGELTWLTSPAHRIQAGDIAGHLSTLGYIQIKIKGKIYLAHRLAFFYMNGRWPENEMDHINHVRNDNRWCNIREATSQENCRNSPLRKDNTSGHCGVEWRKDRKRWQALIKINGKALHLGYYIDKLKAVSRREMAEVLYNFHPNHGKDLKPH